MTYKFEEIKQYLPMKIIDAINLLDEECKTEMSEIRLRLARPSSVTYKDKNVVLFDSHNAQSILLDPKEMEECFLKLCERSIYKYESEIKNGYITLPGGCRVGFCGSKSDSGWIKNVSSFNFRISRKIENAASELYSIVLDQNKIHSSLIVGGPCSGKTTILSDLAYFLSSNKFRVSIIDERGELAAVHNGIPRKSVGKMCDILDNYSKGEGMMIALRALSPQALICDEIGTRTDVEMMLEAMNAGVPVISSAHSDGLKALLHRPHIKKLIDAGAIDKIILLSGASAPGQVKNVIDTSEYYENIGNNIAPLGSARFDDSVFN